MARTFPASTERPDRRRWHCLALVVLCTGCVPLMPHRVYEPEASGGTMPRNRCWGTYETIVFDRGPIEVRAQVIRRKGSDRLIEMAVSVPGGHRVRVEGARVELFGERDPEQPIATHFSGVAAVQTPDAHLMPIGTTMHGETFSGGPRSVRRHYWLYAPVDLEALPNFSVVLPALEIDGRSTELPMIRFRRRTRWQFFAPFQC